MCPAVPRLEAGILWSGFTYYRAIFWAINYNYLLISSLKKAWKFKSRKLELQQFPACGSRYRDGRAVDSEQGDRETLFTPNRSWVCKIDLRIKLSLRQPNLQYLIAAKQHRSSLEMKEYKKVNVLSVYRTNNRPQQLMWYYSSVSGDVALIIKRRDFRNFNV